MSEALESLLKTLELDAAGNTKASIARALAEKLDQGRHEASGAVAMATSSIAKELREVIDALLDSTADDAAWATDLFAEVRNSADT